jgi:hypothetical protein
MVIPVSHKLSKTLKGRVSAASTAPDYGHTVLVDGLAAR